jgi:hypothetical protein
MAYAAIGGLTGFPIALGASLALPLRVQTSFRSQGMASQNVNRRN